MADAGFAILLAFDGDKGGYDATERNGAKLAAYIAAANAWHLTSWSQFDSLPADVALRAWAVLADRATDHTDSLAERQGIVTLPLTRPRRHAPQRTWTPPKAPRTGRDLDSIPTGEYVHALTGLDIEPGRRADCPLPDHDDHSRDFLAYEENCSWVCYGCNRGGRIFDFAAAVWGIGPVLRGDAFRDVRDRLHETFG